MRFQGRNGQFKEERAGRFCVPSKCAQPVVAPDAEKPGAGELFVTLYLLLSCLQ
jgi:hypothetical protein